MQIFERMRRVVDDDNDIVVVVTCTVGTGFVNKRETNKKYKKVEYSEYYDDELVIVRTKIGDYRRKDDADDDDV
jgi:hypothetical protein